MKTIIFSKSYEDWRKINQILLPSKMTLNETEIRANTYFRPQTEFFCL